VKRVIAARVAAELNRERGIEARVAKGGLGELSVRLDGEEIVRTNPLWYPMPSTVVKKSKAKLGIGAEKCDE
jgi:hypothetical protein